MGGVASKEVAKKATRAAAGTNVSTSNASIAKNTKDRVVQTTLTREQLEAAHASGRTVNAMHNPLAARENRVELMEMKDELLSDVKLFDDYDKVEFLEENTAAFKQTASSYRQHSSSPVSMPQDRTSAVATGTFVVETTPGRLTSKELRTLLRLHYESPTEWTGEALATKYGMEVDTVLSILRSVGPPDVLPPRGPNEYPFGVWFPPTPAQLP